jgi:hypothetical protein
MRITILDTYYDAFLERFYARRPELAAEPYALQWRALMDECFGTFDAYSNHLNALGHEAAEIVPNCLPLQARWTEENRTARAEARMLRAAPSLRGSVRAELLRRIALAQIREADPDVVYLQTLSFLRPRQLAALRREGRLVVGQIASPLPRDELVHALDLVLTSFPHFVERIRTLGPESLYFPLAFDARVLARLRDAGEDPAADSTRAHGAVFVGGVQPHVHRGGTALLERLCAEREVEVWGYGADALPADSAIRRSHRGEAWGLDMYRVLADSRVAINRHIDAAEGYANNMRLFEAAGMGALVVTEAAPNLADLFEPGREVAAYRSFDELLELVDLHVSDDAARTSIAAAGQQRVLRDHTYEKRMVELAEILEPRVNAAAGQRRSARRGS